MEENTIYLSIATLIIILIWMTVMTLIFINRSPEKIRAIGDFFAKVLPKIPFSDIIRAIRGE